MPPPLQNFIDKVSVVPTNWLNAVDSLATTVFEQNTPSKAIARQVLTNDVPFEVANGGTGVRTLGALSSALGSVAIYGVESGAANSYVFTHSGSLAATLAAGTLIRLTVLSTNTGPSALNADGTGAVAIIRANGAALTGGELSSLGPVVLQSTGTQWQIVATAGAQPGFERTAAETAAAVIPTNYGWPAGDVHRHGAVGDNVADDTTAISNALLSNNAITFHALTYKVSSTTAYCCTVPAQIRIQGVYGFTTLKLASATAATTSIFGSSSTSTLFWMEGMILDGNKGVVSAVNTRGVTLTQATDVISRRNTYQNFKDQGSIIGGIGISLNNSTQVNRLQVEEDTFQANDCNPIQTTSVCEITFRDNFAQNLLRGMTEFNGQTLGVNNRTKVSITNNVVICDPAFPAGISVFSLLGDDVECVGNKVVGGTTQIVVHDETATSYQLRNYNVSGNYLWQAKSSAIVVNQTSATYGNNWNQQITIGQNLIYQPVGDGIAVIGTYAGSGTLYGSTSIIGNVIVDGLTTPIAPDSVACIRTLGATNVTIDGNVCIAPRLAGVLMQYDGRNIVVSNNVITNHQGVTTVGGGTGTPQADGPICVMSGNATAYLGNINITGNVIQNWATAVSPSAQYTRTGGIVVDDNKAQDVSIKNNRLMTGNTCAISLLNCINVTVEGNEASGYFAPALNIANGVGTGCLLSRAFLGPDRVVVTYSASMTFDVTTGRTFEITATNGTAFTINNPTNPQDGMRITVRIYNTSGGALGVVTWGAAFKMSAWTSPATANNRSIDFEYNSTNAAWYQTSPQNSADVPN